MSPASTACNHRTRGFSIHTCLHLRVSPACLLHSPVDNGRLRRPPLSRFSQGHSRRGWRPSSLGTEGAGRLPAFWPRRLANETRQLRKGRDRDRPPPHLKNHFNDKADPPSFHASQQPLDAVARPQISQNERGLASIMGHWSLAPKFRELQQVL